MLPPPLAVNSQPPMKEMKQIASQWRLNRYYRSSVTITIRKTTVGGRFKYNDSLPAGVDEAAIRQGRGEIYRQIPKEWLNSALSDLESLIDAFQALDYTAVLELVVAQHRGAGETL